jgi:hypothetical protein
MFQVNAMGIFGLVSVAMCWALAVVLYRVGATGGVARKLALLMVVEGFTLVNSGYIGLLLTPAAMASSWYPAFSQAEDFVHVLGDCTLLALYPPFLAAALHTKLTRPFATKRIRISLAVVALAIFLAVFLTPLEIGVTLLYATMTLLFAYALIASIHAWRVAAPGIARTRAGVFVLAFGFRDVCWGFIYTHGISLIVRGLLGEPEPDFFHIIYASGTFFAVPLIAYGILRTQLFDIDLRIRWTIKHSTVAAVFVAIFYLVSEGADRLLESEFGNIAGLIASTLVVFFLVPLQRFAERVASVAMPNTENTPEYAMFRKLQVYEAALTEALPDGSISERERDLLNRLRDSLGISTVDANAIERELQDGLPSIP